MMYRLEKLYPYTVREDTIENLHLYDLFKSVYKFKEYGVYKQNKLKVTYYMFTKKDTLKSSYAQSKVDKFIDQYPEYFL